MVMKQKTNPLDQNSIGLLFCFNRYPRHKTNLLNYLHLDSIIKFRIPPFIPFLRSCTKATIFSFFERNFCLVVTTRGNSPSLLLRNLPFLQLNLNKYYLGHPFLFTSATARSTDNGELAAF